MRQIYCQLFTCIHLTLVLKCLSRKCCNKVGRGFYQDEDFNFRFPLRLFNFFFNIYCVFLRSSTLGIIFGFNSTSLSEKILSCEVSISSFLETRQLFFCVETICFFLTSKDDHFSTSTQTFSFVNATSFRRLLVV